MPADLLLPVLLVLVVVQLIMIVVLLWRSGRPADTGALAAIAEEGRRQRQESAQQARELRDELQARGRDQETSLRESFASHAQAQRQSFADFSEAQGRSLQQVAETLKQSGDGVATAVKTLQDGNEQKLEQMRATVDEKLQGTLDKRLGESFQLVSERLEAVSRGLGEMQSLASDVGSLQRVLSNVKTRGIFGEAQLAAILEQMLTADQYVRDYAPRPESRDAVEFAVRMPGSGAAPVFLPVDAKFPQEDYLRLLAAVEANDADALKAARTALAKAVLGYAKSVKEKYVHPPATTDFAVIFLPTENLFAEVLREPGLFDQLGREHRVMLTGPTTLSALLNSLRVGFQTVAIEQRSHEVTKTLRAVKTEFGKFGDVLERVKKQLGTAAKTLDETNVRTRAMERSLRGLEALPAGESAELFGLPDELLLSGGDDVN